MPNYVANIVKMEGIAKLPLFIVEDGKRHFDFNKMIKMPESLNIESRSTTEQRIMYYLTERCTIPVNCLGEEKLETARKLISNMFSKQDEWLRTIFERVMETAYKATEGKRDEMYQKGQTYISNYVNYGATTWYEWCIKNWGTKWNACDTEIIDEDTIKFDTAWSSPEPVIAKLAEMYPDAVIEHWWADEDMGSNTGYKHFYHGQETDGCYYDTCSNEAYDTYITCWGETECLYKDEDGNWQRHSCETCHGCD